MPLCNALFKENPHDPERLYLRGRALYLTSNFPMAIKHFSEALRSDPDYAKAKNMLKLVKKVYKSAIAIAIVINERFRWKVSRLLQMKPSKRENMKMH